MSLNDSIDFCIENRKFVAQIIADVLAVKNGCNEKTVQQALLRAIKEQPDFHDRGWYDPPPGGVGVLFADENDEFERSKFPTLRTEQYWPHENYKLTDETVGTIYVSPVHRASGIIGDMGLTFYCGTREDIKEHLKQCLIATEDIAEQARAGMMFKELYAIGQQILAERQLHNDWMITLNDPTHGADYGHTLPWTYENTTSDEKRIIESKDFNQIKELISDKRLYINPIEEFVIPPTIAFSIEPRIGSKLDPKLPGGYFYCTVIFKDGKRQIINNINTIFDTLKINYMRSRF